ncbi:MAG: methyltransferase domain-containing protein [bacterium]|nr:methyltransferase domain-containing protein [bacterium]
MPETKRDYFNRIAPRWDGMAPIEPRLKEYLLRFGIAEGDRVLDAGAGTGISSALIRECAGASGFVVAQDVAEAMLHGAKKRLAGEGAACVGSDAQDLPFRDGAFDKVLCFSAFPHFPDPRKALAEMRRVLKAGGKALVLHASSHRELNRFHAALDAPVRHDVLPSPDALTGLFEAEGFRVLRAEESEKLYWVEGEKRGSQIEDRRRLTGGP